MNDPLNGKVELCETRLTNEGLFHNIIDSLRRNLVSELNISLKEYSEEICGNMYLLMKELRCLREAGSDVNVNWYFEDENMEIKSCGEDFREIFGLDIALIEVNQR